MGRKIKQSPKLPAAKRREQLLSAARKLFVRKGYQGTTTEEIARAAGLTKGALYFHFGSKDEILLDLLKINAEAVDRMVREHLSGERSLVDHFRLLLELHCCGHPSDQGDMVDLWIQGFRVPRVRRYISLRIRRGVADVAESVRSCGGVGRHAPEDVAVFLMAMIDGLSSMRMLLPPKVDIDAQVELFASLVGTGGRADGKRGERSNRKTAGGGRR